MSYSRTGEKTKGRNNVVEKRSHVMPTDVCGLVYETIDSGSA